MSRATLCSLALATLLGGTASAQPEPPPQPDPAPASAPTAATAPADTTDAARPLASYARTDALMFTLLGMGLIHHTDHVLRDNHSSWPFKRDVGPTTFSYLVYPAYLVPWFLDAGPLVYAILDPIMLVAVTLPHVLAEPPDDLFRSWTNRTNLLGIRSVPIARVSQVVTASLSGLIAAHLVSSIVDGRTNGFTWRRSKTRPPAISLFGGPTAEGGAFVGAGGRF